MRNVSLCPITLQPWTYWNPSAEVKDILSYVWMGSSGSIFLCISAERTHHSLSYRQTPVAKRQEYVDSFNKAPQKGCCQ